MKMEPLAFKISQSIDSRIVALLERTRWGTKDVAYYWENIGENLDPLNSAMCFSLAEGEEPIACILLNRKTIHIGDKRIQTYFGSHLSVSPKYIGKGLMKRLAEQVDDFFTRKYRGARLEYAYVEARNIRHMPFFEQRGAVHIAQYRVLGYSRFFPKDDSRVKQLEPSEKAHIVRLLNEAYRDHSFKDFQLSVLPEHYYIIRHNDEIIAGVQISVYQWVIEKLAGLGGWLALNILPHISLLRTLFNPRKFRFLRFGNLYVKAGHEMDLCRLMNALLLRNVTKSGILCIDRRSPIFKRIRSQGLGILNRFIESSVNVFVTPHSIESDTIELLKKQPFHVSMIDQ